MKTKQKRTYTRPIYGILARWYVSVPLLVLLAAGAVYFVNRPLKDYNESRPAKLGFRTQVDNLAGDFAALDMKGFGSEPKTACRTENYEGFEGKNHVCTVSDQQFVMIGSDEKSKADAVEAARGLDRALKANGWTVTSNAAASYEEWFTGITSGKDYLPDIGAYKNTEDVHCGMDISLGFSNPNPPAFNMVMNCSSPVIEPFMNLPS